MNRTQTRYKYIPVRSDAASLGFGFLRRTTSCVHAVVPRTFCFSFHAYVQELGTLI